MITGALNRLGQAAVKRLGNVSATVGGAPVSGIFHAHPVDAFGVAGGSKPELHVMEADVPGAAEGTAVTVDGVAYTVADIKSDGDGTGMTLLALEKV